MFHPISLPPSVFTVGWKEHTASNAFNQTKTLKDRQQKLWARITIKRERIMI